MYSVRRGANRREVNIWPGFVDGLASLLLVVMFVLMVFMVAQFFLTTALSGRDQALEQLNREVSELAELLALERAANADLRINVAQLSSELQSSIAERESLGSQLSALLDERDAVERRLGESEQQRDSLTAQLAALLEEQESLERLLAEAEAVTEKTRAELEQAYGTIEADKEKIEVQLAELAILKSLNDQMVTQLSNMEEALGAQEESAEALRLRIEELEVELAARLQERDKLAADLQERIRAVEESEAARAERVEDLAQAERQLALSEEERNKLVQQLTLSDEERRKLAEQVELTARQLLQAESEAKRQASLAVTLKSRADEAERNATRENELSEAAQAKVTLLNRQIAALRQQLSRLAVALEAAEAANEEKDVKIANLGQRLNVALATKVQELARYRSEFFGRLREVLGQRDDIRVEGDRFVFQSELLFESGSAEIGPQGKVQLARLADTLREVSAKFPAEIDWILRVDGHTDNRPIYTSEFQSNWELSTARALSVVRYLITQGIPAERLAATGFGEFQPIDEGSSPQALSRNRRIEMRLDQR